MTYLTYIPKPPLSELVALFWSDEGYNPPHTKERVLPSGTMELIFNLIGDEIRESDRRDQSRLRSFRGSFICGARSGYFALDGVQRLSVVGVHFKPGGASPFLGLSARELLDANVPLNALWGPRAGELHERLLEAETPGLRFRILERTLLARMGTSPTPHPAVAFALREFRTVPHARTIAQTTERLGISHRHFIKVFGEEVGLTPKLFCRIRRFQEVLRLTEGDQPVNWAELALSCGYFDQAHLIGDFRAFSGLTPGAYLALRGERPNHVTLGDR